jgi:hypothetical protein
MDPLFVPAPKPYSAYAPVARPPRRPRWATAERDDALPQTPAARAAELRRIADQLGRVVRAIRWGRTQNDAWDRHCQFIFRLRSAEGVRERAEHVAQEHHLDSDELVHYALRRWYCFWGARLAELLFLEHPGVVAGPPKDHEVDFLIDDVPFDLKTSELPLAYADRLGDFFTDPIGVATWFYEHQSRERRFHEANRLFLVLVDADQRDEAWRLRADLPVLRSAISAFLARRRYLELWLPNDAGGRHKVLTAVIPVTPAAGDHQLRLKL